MEQVCIDARNQTQSQNKTKLETEKEKRNGCIWFRMRPCHTYCTIFLKCAMHRSITGDCIETPTGDITCSARCARFCVYLNIEMLSERWARQNSVMWERCVVSSPNATVHEINLICLIIWLTDDERKKHCTELANADGVAPNFLLDESVWKIDEDN